MPSFGIFILYDFKQLANFWWVFLSKVKALMTLFHRPKIRLSLRVRQQAYWPAVRTISSAWFDHVEEGFLVKQVSSKTSCPTAKNANANPSTSAPPRVLYYVTFSLCWKL